MILLIYYVSHGKSTYMALRKTNLCITPAIIMVQEKTFGFAFLLIYTHTHLWSMCAQDAFEISYVDIENAGVAAYVILWHVETYSTKWKIKVVCVHLFYWSNLIVEYGMYYHRENKKKEAKIFRMHSFKQLALMLFQYFHLKTCLLWKH